MTGQPQRVSGFVAVAPVDIPRHEGLLDKITVPVLAVWGEHDQLISQAYADLLADRVADGAKVVVSGRSHALYMNDPAAFHKVLLDFLGRLSP